VRTKWWALLLPMMAACSNSLTTGPTEIAVPQFSIRFTVANPASLSLSEPMSCAGDWSTCARGSQAQGPATASAITVRDYALAPGTYRLTGVLQPSTPAGASVDIQIGASATANRGGVVREGPVVGFVAFNGDGVPRSSVTSLVCGATFSNQTGALEWSITFRVASATAMLCRFFSA
jgi:hypothetical protein